MPNTFHTYDKKADLSHVTYHFGSFTYHLIYKKETKAFYFLKGHIYDNTCQF